PADDAVSSRHFAYVHVSLRIRSSAVNVEKLPKSASAMSAEEAHHLQRFAVHDMHFAIAAVGHEEKLLLLVRRESNIKRRAFRAGGLAPDKGFLNERPIQFENLNTVVHAVTHIDQAIV